MHPPNRSALVQKVFGDLRYFIAFGFGSGLSPKAPGTFGTLAAIPLYLLMARLPILAFLTLTALLFLVGWYCAEKVGQDLKMDDYKGIVIDEIVGYLITMMFVPFAWQWVIAGFVLFRFFDILKPFPIALIDAKLKGGLGVMLDDVIAGLMSGIVLYWIA